MKASLKVALFLGVAPLVTGMVIFAAWVLSRAEWLMAAGVITIYVGMCAVAVGAVCLAVYLWQSWRSKAIARRRLVCQAIAVLGLFLANFLAAGGAAFAAIVIDTRYTVSVTNQTNVPLESARIEGGGVDVPLGIIAPGATVNAPRDRYRNSCCCGFFGLAPRLTARRRQPSSGPERPGSQ